MSAVAATVSTDAYPERMTFDEFVAWVTSDEDIWAEWENGKVIRLSSNTVHQQLVVLLLGIIQFWVARQRLGGVLLTAPYLMVAAAGGSGREPDILYITRENKGRLTGTRLNGPADLVVEVVSPESRRRDRNIKFFEYERAGVREYWVLDPDIEDAEFYQRNEATGRFQRVELTGEGENLYNSAVLNGMFLLTDWLWQDPLPDVLDVLREWDTTS